MRIAVIGAGNIGGTLGESWEKAGHDVTYQLRDPDKKKGAVPLGQDLDKADVVLLALPGAEVVGCVEAHAKALDGRRDQRLPRALVQLMARAAEGGSRSRAVPRVQHSRRRIAFRLISD